MMSDPLDERRVFVQHLETAEYPEAPYHPPLLYPELQDLLNNSEIDPKNEVYACIRQIFFDLKADASHFGTREWDPLKDIVAPGDKVILKPNLVFHKHPLGKEGVRSMITHASVLRPIIDYVWIALRGKGQIIIADVPLQTADWSELLRLSGIDVLMDYARQKGIPLQALDLRLERAKTNVFGVIVEREKYHGDPLGYVAVDIGRESQLMPIMPFSKKLMITDYPQGSVSMHHHGEKNEYLIPKTILSSDVFFNLPKLKTHKKGGVTLCMKNLIGINGDKSWIAHHRQGGVGESGDEYPSISWWDNIRFRLFVALKKNAVGITILAIFLRALNVLHKTSKRLGKGETMVSHLSTFKGITEGSWSGNDTLWRVILDLNRILLYANTDGKMEDQRTRNVFHIIDGVIGGEKNGPMHHYPKKSGRIIAGGNPLATDTVAAHLMGFDYKKIPQLFHGFDKMHYPLTPCDISSITIVEQGNEQSFDSWRNKKTLAFLAPDSWKGYIEHTFRDAKNESREENGQFSDAGGE